MIWIDACAVLTSATNSARTTAGSWARMGEFHKTVFVDWSSLCRYGSVLCYKLMVGTTYINFEVTSAERYVLDCDKVCHFIKLNNLNKKCAKSQCSVMLISVFKMMLKIWNKWSLSRKQTIIFHISANQKCLFSNGVLVDLWQFKHHTSKITIH